MIDIFVTMNAAYVYLNYCPQLELYKIGVSINYQQRNISLQTGNPYEIITKEAFYSKYPYKLESVLHRDFKLYKTNMDDIKLKGEWFNLPQNIVSEFLEKCEIIENNFVLLLNAGNFFIIK